MYVKPHCNIGEKLTSSAIKPQIMSKRCIIFLFDKNNYDHKIPQDTALNKRNLIFFV